MEAKSLEKRRLQPLFPAVIFLWFLALIILTRPASLRGQEPESAPDAGNEEEEGYRTVVTALGFEDKEFDSPRSMEVVDEEDMKRLKGRSTPELLSETTGVFVQKTAHGHGAPIIRGVIGIHNLILFNEIRLNNSTWRTGPIQYLNLIDPFSIEKIEVLRGPGSLMYGSDAIGGVVSVFGKSPLLTEKPTIAPGLSGKFSSADLGYAGHYSLRLGCGTFGTVFGGSYKNFNDLRAGPGVGLQKFTGYEEADFDFNARVKLFSGGWLELGTYLVRLFDVGRIDQLQANNRLRYSDNGRDLVYIRFIGKEKLLDLDYKLTLSYQHQTEVNKDIRYASLYDVISRVTYDNIYVDTAGFSGTVTKKFLEDRLELSGGVDIYSDFVDADSIRLDGGVIPAFKQSLFPSDSRYSTYELYALVRWNVRRHAKGLHLWGGGRFSYTTAFAPHVLDYGDISYAHPAGTGSAGINYTLKEILNAGITFSEGYRSPKLSETVIFGDMGTAFEIPNPDLGPERAESLEVFAKYSCRLLDVNMAFFTTWFFDLLAKTAAAYNGQAEIDGKPVQRTENLDRAMVLGPEASLVFHFGKLFRADGLKLKGNLAYLWGNQELCDEGACEKHPMQRIPPLFFTAVLGYYDEDRDDFDYSAEVIVHGAVKQDRLSPEDISDVRIPEGGTPGWTTLSLRGMFEYKRRLLVTIVLENLLNETYKIHGSGIYEPGMNGSINLAVRY